MTPSDMVCAAVVRNPGRCLDQQVTPFATPRQLMGGSPLPSRWRPFARRRWLAKLAVRVAEEIESQERFAAALSILLGRLT